MKRRWALHFLLAALVCFSVSIQALASTTVQYTYDSLNRLATATYGDGTVITYAYDADGNRLTQSVTGGTNASATHFSVSAPSSATAGTAVSFTVMALGSGNNTVTGYAGTVHFTSTDGSAALPANATLTNGTGTFSATLKTAGSQTITATDTGTSSITGTSNAIAVNTNITARFSGRPESGKMPLQVKFSDESTGIIKTWSWNFGDNQTSKARNPSHTYTKAGIYTVELTVKGPSGTNTLSQANYITVYAPPKPNFTAVPTSGKDPLTVQFTDASTNTVTSWLWNFGDKTTSSDQNTSHTYNKAGNYTVELTVTGPGGTKIATKVRFIKVSK